MLTAMGPLAIDMYLPSFPTIARDLGKTIELASGIDAHDRVIESPPDSIANGDVVRVAAAEAAGKPATDRGR